MASAVPFVSGVVKTYGSLKEYTDDGGATTDPAYLAMTALLSQNPRPKNVKVGKRGNKPTQTVTLKCLTAVTGAVYSIDIGLPGGNMTTVTYTVPGSSTTTTVATAIEVLIEAVTGIDSTSSTDTITVTATAGAGQLFDCRNWTRNFKLTNTTTDPGIAADLALVTAADRDWYGLVLDSNSKAEIEATAAYVEANKKLFPCPSSDSACYDSTSTTDVMAELKALSYARTGVMFSGSKLLSYSGAAWLGSRLPADPGSDTWAFKKLVGVPADILTAGEHNAIINKAGNTYETVAGLPITFEGTSAAHEYFDVTRFIDWLQAEIQIRIFGVMANAAKIPFTDQGAAVIQSIIDGTLKDGVAVGGLASDPAPKTIVPLVKDVNGIDKGNRNLPNVTFTAELAGAIHKLTINGTLSI